MTIEDYLEKPYWVIDFLPRQVPADSRGQYFRVEEFFLEHPRIDALYRKFANIVLKLNCYEDLSFSQDGENVSAGVEWVTNPAPKLIEQMVAKCLSAKRMLYVVVESSEEMITLGSDDMYMTVYNASERTLGLLGSLAAAEGLFVWKPEQ
jgi:hypothetical protein